MCTPVVSYGDLYRVVSTSDTAYVMMAGVRLAKRVDVSATTHFFLWSHTVPVSKVNCARYPLESLQHSDIEAPTRPVN